MINFFILEPVTEDEILDILKELKNSAPGCDEIKAGPLKIGSQFLVKPLSHLCNLSLNQGKFPEELKIANVIPLYK